jgi:transposase InsO family protein
LIVIEYGSRRLVHCSVTEHPTAEWTLRQLREAIPYEHPYRFLIHDRDKIFSKEFDRSISRLGIDVIETPYRSPQANSICERVIGSMRRKFLDHSIVLNERHLKRLLSGYFDYYHRWRTHRSLDMDTPARRATRPTRRTQVIEFPAVDGLHHYYLLKSA